MKAVVFLMLVVLLGAVFLGHTLKAVSIAEVETQNMRVQLRATQATLSKSQADLQSLTQKLAAIEAERDTALNANNSLLALMEDLKGNVETLRGENEALRGRVQELEQALQASQAQSTSGMELGALFQSRGLWAILAPALLIVLVGAGYSGLRLTGKFESVPHTLAYAAKTGSPGDTVVVRMPRERVPKYVRWSRQVEREETIPRLKKIESRQEPRSQSGIKRLASLLHSAGPSPNDTDDPALLNIRLVKLQLAETAQLPFDSSPPRVYTLGNYRNEP